MWLTTDSVDGVHIIPIGDSLEHEESRACPCQPQSVLCDGPSHVVVKDVYGVPKQVAYQYVRHLVTHSAWDGRPE